MRCLLRLRCLYARLTLVVCFFAAAAAAAAAAVESIDNVWAGARLDDTGLARSSDKVKRPRSAVEEATSVAREALASCW